MNLEHRIRVAVDSLEAAIEAAENDGAPVGLARINLRFLRALLYDNGWRGSRAFECAVTDCANMPTCFGQYESEENPIAFSCDAHCGHGNEDGRCDMVVDVL